VLNKRRCFAISILAVLIIVSMNAQQVSAVGAISPSSTSALIGMSATYTVTGLDATDIFSVQLGGVTVLSDLVPTTGGSLSFSVSGTVAGTFIVGVYNSTPLLQCSAQLVVNDLMATLIPILTIFIGITILLGLVKELKF